MNQEALQRIATGLLEDNKETELAFLNRSCPETISVLRKHSPDFWKNYGPYWWCMKDILNQYAPRQFREYAQASGGEEVMGQDDEIKKQYDCGSDILNFTAAQTYLESRAPSFGADSSHTVVTPEGDMREYIPGVGFVDEQ